MKFRATLELHGKSATGIAVPDEVVDALGGGKKPAVTVTINGFSYRTSVAPRGGAFLIPVSGERRAAAGIAAGDEIEVDIELDTAPREVEVADDLAAALAEAGVREAFDKLSYSHQSAHALSVESAKAAETRARRIAAVVTALSA